MLQYNNKLEDRRTDLAQTGGEPHPPSGTQRHPARLF